MMRRLSVVVALLGSGCHLMPPAPEPAALPATAAADLLPMHQKVSAADDGVLAPDSDLAQAAACLERGEETAACALLASHIASHPHHVSLRAQHAELLMQLNRLSEARDEFERFAAVAQERGDGLLPLLVHAHSRLVELAERREDDYQEHLQRGLGLYWLAKRTLVEQQDGDMPDGAMPVEGLYFKAAADLIKAHHLQPDEARPCWYLYLIWHDLARQQFALRWLRDTRALADESYLTPGEQRRLHLASQALDVRR